MIKWNGGKLHRDAQKIKAGISLEHADGYGNDDGADDDGDDDNDDDNDCDNDGDNNDNDDDELSA